MSDFKAVYFNEEKRIRLKSNPIVRGYISGFFDAEGTVGFVEESGTPSISFKQTYRPVLDDINRILDNGKVTQYIPKNKNKISFRLRIFSQDSEDFLEYITPNLIDKRQQAEILLHYLKTSKPATRDYFRISDTQKQQRKWVDDELKRLKHGQYNDSELKNYENELDNLKIPKDIREGKQAILTDLDDLKEELGINKSNNSKNNNNNSNNNNNNSSNLNSIKNKIPDMSKDILIGYMSGFFDGEGFVGIQRGKRDSYSLRLAVVNSNFDILNNIYQNNYNGKIRPKNYKDAKEYFKKLWLWELQNDDALQFLRVIYPFTIVKKQQIGFAIKFQEFHNSVRIIKSLEQKKKAEYFRLKIKELKKEIGEIDIDDIEEIDKEQKDILTSWDN